jgi:hypothetical protein
MENYHLESFNDIPNVLDRRRDKERELVANGLNVRDSEPGSNCFMPNPGQKLRMEDTLPDSVQ